MKNNAEYYEKKALDEILAACESNDAQYTNATVVIAQVYATLALAATNARLCDGVDFIGEHV